MTKWQPIETAPRDGSEIIIATRGGYVSQAWFSEQAQAFCLLPLAYLAYADPEDLPIVTPNIVNPTHWMPLPPPPQSGETI